MGAGGASSGGGGGGNNKTYSSSREIGLMNQYKPEKKKKTVTGFDRKTGKKYSYETTVNQRDIDTRKMKNEAFKEQGAYTTRRRIDKLPAFLPGAAIVKGLSPALQENSRRTRSFFRDKVLTDPRGKKNFGYTKDEFEKLSMAKQNKIYSNYITTRRDNKTDGYGTVFREGNDNNDQPKLKIGKPVQPNEDDVAERILPVEDDKDDKDDSYDIRKTKRRGRRRTILTSQTGVGGNLVLGKPTLLGT